MGDASTSRAPSLTPHALASDASSEAEHSEPRLIISIDIGTSQSAVAVFYRKRGVAPVATHIARWPGQESLMHMEKVPSVLIYDINGQLVACGAEAASREKALEAEDNEWSYVYNFKMHLHTAAILEKGGLLLNDLPPNVNLLQVYTDFFRYLYGHTRSYIRETIGFDPWLSSGNQAEVILTHPNGWTVIQQRFLQKAVVAAGLVPANVIRMRLHFLEESEASTSYCMSINPTLTDHTAVGSKFIVCDGGGSTADISAYRVRSKLGSGMSLAEIGLPSCIDGGGARVDAKFKLFLEDSLKKADIEDRDDGTISDALRDFECHCKRTYDSPSTSCTVRVGGRKMNSNMMPITKGVLNLDGSTTEQFFKPSIDAIIRDIQKRLDRNAIEFIILTGGFGESPYLKKCLKTRLDPPTAVIIGNAPNSKAVAIGALRLLTEGPGKVTIKRTRRPWKTWIANIADGFRQVFRK